MRMLLLSEWKKTIPHGNSLNRVKYIYWLWCGIDTGFMQKFGFVSCVCVCVYAPQYIWKMYIQTQQY